jgi:hypothetical protein
METDTRAPKALSMAAQRSIKGVVSIPDITPKESMPEGARTAEAHARDARRVEGR